MILVLVFEDNPTAPWIAIQASPNLRVPSGKDNRGLTLITHFKQSDA